MVARYGLREAKKGNSWQGRMSAMQSEGTVNAPRLPARRARMRSLCMIAVCLLSSPLAGCPPAAGPALGTNADLDDLTLSSGSLSPAFAADTTAYSAFVNSGTANITVTPAAADPNATIEVRCDGGGWAGVLSGSACPSLAMNMGMNSVEVRATAEDGTVTKTYVITMYKGIVVPDEFTTIQKAIDETADGDWVLVRPDTYTENIVFPTDRSITVRSTHGADSTTVDGGGTDSVVKFPASSQVSELHGFTITYGAVAGGQGGGIDVYQCSPMITNCVITGNSSWLGGGIRCDGASPMITGCTLSGNSAEVAGAGVGGGMCNTNSSTPTLSNCTFEGNAADYRGGGMWNANSSPILIDCTFSGNTAASAGGGIYNASSSPTVSGCSFITNDAATGQGSGMFNTSSSPTVINCLFYKNRSLGYSGAEMRNEANSSPTVTNCTFLMILDWQFYNSNSSPTVTNCILWEDLPEPIKNVNSSSPVVTYSDLSGPYAGTGNINSNPLFVDPNNGDLHLQASSPCIDAGNNSAPDLPATDIDGDARIVNGTVDMGADEYSP